MIRRFIALSASAIEDLFYSESFCSRLNRAAKGTSRTGHEYSFMVYRRGNSEVLRYSDVRKGTTEEAAGDEEPRSERRHRFLEQHHTVIDLHFHPDPSAPVPSFPDLTRVDASSLGLHDRPIVAIGSARRGGQGELLLLQRTTNQPLAGFFYQELRERLHSIGNVNDIEALPGLLVMGAQSGPTLGC